MTQSEKYSFIIQIDKKKCRPSLEAQNDEEPPQLILEMNETPMAIAVRAVQDDDALPPQLSPMNSQVVEIYTKLTLYDVRNRNQRSVSMKEHC